MIGRTGTRHEPKLKGFPAHHSNFMAMCAGASQKEQDMRKAILAATLLILAGTAKADGITYQFTLDNAPGVGTFSWEVTVPALLTATTIFTGFNQISPPANCSVSNVTIYTDGQNGLGLFTNFAPLCLGLFDSTMSGIDETGPGSFTWSGHNPDDTIYTNNLSIFASTLPLSTFTVPSTETPEPSTIVFLTAAVICAFLIMWPRKRFR